MRDPGLTQPVAGIEIAPTYFYVRRDGEMRELVNVTISLPGVAGPAALTFTIAGTEYRATPAPGRFGQQRFEFAVPEFAADTPAKVSPSKGRCGGRPSGTPRAFRRPAGRTGSPPTGRAS